MAYFESAGAWDARVGLVLMFLGGACFGYALHVPAVPATHRLAKTDGVICMAESDTGPHWLVRPDGWCDAADNPALQGGRVPGR